LRRGDSGFYSYVIFERTPGLPAAEVYQARIVFKLNKARWLKKMLIDLREKKTKRNVSLTNMQPMI